MRHAYPKRMKGMVKASVVFDGGAVIMDVPFWQTDESIVREAMECLGPLAAGVKNASVERGEFY